MDVIRMLRAEEIYYTNGDQEILKGISFEAKKGEHWTITGPSGGGKSTLLKIVSSLLTPTKGTVYFEDKDMMEMGAINYRRQVSYCFQQPSLFGDTVKDNLEFPFILRNETYDEANVTKLLQAVDLSEDYLTKDIQSISGGEKQRVALIRNLIFPPKVLLLDEVTTGLDETSKEIVWQLIQKVNQEGITILQVTHDKEEIAVAKQVLSISGGRVDHESSSF